MPTGVYERHTARPVTERLWPKVRKTDNCWEWTGATNGAGYGQIHMAGDDGRRQRYVHRVVYETLVGPIPKGMTLDHLCRNPRCVRPDHLEVVTMGVNVLRGTSPLANKARQTTCLEGHPFDRLYVDKDGRRHRGCSICQRRSRVEHYARTGT